MRRFVGRMDGFRLILASSHPNPESLLRYRWDQVPGLERARAFASTLAPSLLSDEGNEANSAEVRLLKASVFPRGHLDEVLTVR